ncbi:M48 family metalloprotease [uncultured Endozoicomonas sp.]|uniref:M48 family metalloprotease n=1 Tax=uncultured Endozoicomonas sp. TaxID=432652 RepID=UPI0026363429|nr:M48 family metalloprotease [uncultured Endozoicomonas sp.]
MSGKIPVLLITILLISGCKTMQTMSDGITKALDMRPVHEKFDGQFIESTNANKPAEHYEEIRQEIERTRENVFIKATTKDDVDSTDRGWNFSKDDMMNQIKAAEFIHVPAFQKYMDRIAARLLKHWPGEKPDIQFTTRLNYNQQYGASTKGDGVLVIYLGTVKSIKSEDELAFLIAHEMAHNLLHHNLRQDYLDVQSKWLEASFNTASAVVMAQNFDITKGLDGKKTLTLTNQDVVAKALVRNSAYIEQTKTLTDTLWSGRWSRVLEQEADLLATDLIIRAGYSKGATRQAIQRIAASQSGSKEKLKDISQAQQQALSTAFEEQGLSGVINQGSSLLTSSLMKTGDELLGKLSMQHASPEDREAYIQQYAIREYRSSPRIKYNRDHLKALSHPKTNAIITAHMDITQALSALANNDIDHAYSLGKKVLKSPAGNSNRARVLMYQIRKAQGKNQTALKNLELIRDWDLAPVSTYDLIIKEYRKNGQFKQAGKYLQQAHNKYGEALFYPESILLSIHNKDTEKANKDYESCMDTENATIKTACTQAMAGLNPEVLQSEDSKSTTKSLLESVGKALLL